MKEKNRKKRAVLLVTAPFLAATTVWAQEDENQLYEDDAWWDISEWLDGNDYNPTDERIAVWDDEVYGNDDRGWFWNDDDADDDWYYDGYHGIHNSYAWYPDHGHYGYSSRFFDYDGDGAYDAYYAYTDWDGDGLYESTEYVTVGDYSADHKSKSDTHGGTPESAKKAEMTGKIAKMKEVHVRGDKRTVVQMETPDGKTVIADLGDSKDLGKLSISEGGEITVAGPRSKVGEHPVIFAHELQCEGKTVEIDRSAMNLSGQVQDNRNIQVRGKEHVMAVIQVQDGSTQRSWLVDLGPADAMEKDLTKGQDVEVSGIPCKKGDHYVLLAEKVTTGGREHDVDRRSQSSHASSKPVEAGAKKR